MSCCSLLYSKQAKQFSRSNSKKAFFLENFFALQKQRIRNFDLFILWPVATDKSMI